MISSCFFAFPVLGAAFGSFPWYRYMYENGMSTFVSIGGNFVPDLESSWPGDGEEFERWINMPDSETHPKWPSQILTSSCLSALLDPLSSGFGAISSTVLGTTPITVDRRVASAWSLSREEKSTGHLFLSATRNCMKAPSCARFPNADACCSSSEPSEKSNRDSVIVLYVVWGSSESNPCFAPHPPPPLTIPR